MFDREIIQEILPFLDTDDILLFYGARQVGKTSLMKILQEKYIKVPSYFFDLEDEDDFDNVSHGTRNFISYLKNFCNWDEETKIVVFIDEIQYLDNPTSFLKVLHDHYPHLKLIVSWSSTLEIRGKFKDSLAWRLLKFDILPLSFKEFLNFKGKWLLANAIWKRIEFWSVNRELIFFFKEYLTFGGYPKVVLANTTTYKNTFLKEIYESYLQKDIKDIGKIRDVSNFNKLLKILALQVWNLLNLSELSSKIGVSLPTIKEWIFLLENTFIIRCITPFSNAIRWELIKTPKVLFIDTGLRNYCAKTFEIDGENFENSFFEYLLTQRKYENINFYRTKDKQEIDFILDGKPYELKLSYTGKNISAFKGFKEKTGESGQVVTLKKDTNFQENVRYPREV